MVKKVSRWNDPKEVESIEVKSQKPNQKVVQASALPGRFALLPKPKELEQS